VRLVEENHATIVAAAKLQEGMEYRQGKEARKQMLQCVRLLIFFYILERED
jgi:hypothetical protein